MSYQIIFRERAQKEYAQAVSWYKESSVQAAENFIKQVQIILTRLKKQPDFFRRSFRHFHETKTAKYPYSIVYLIDEEKEQVVITSIFHQKRNPKLKFRN